MVASVEAIADHPHKLIGLAPIMRMAFEGRSLTTLTDKLIGRIHCDETDAPALLDLSVVFQLISKPEVALDLQRDALSLQQLYEPYTNPPKPGLKVLAILCAGEIMDNAPLEFLIEDSDIALELMYVGSDIPAVSELPEHDLAVVAVCESDKNQSLLASLAEAMKYWPRPLINWPAQIAQLSRPTVSQRLKDVKGVAVCEVKRTSRRELTEALRTRENPIYPFPCIIRPVDSHAGKGLSKLDNWHDLRVYLSNQTAEEYYLSPFVDYRSTDGLFRKYRIAVVDGQPFAAHLAISPRWMVHYLNADMLDNPLNQQAEASFMAEFDREWAIRHRDALMEIDRRIGLEYYSMDCAETPDGRLLVFEIDSGAVVHSMDCGEEFAYKKPHMRKVFSAFRDLLYRKTGEFKCQETLSKRAA